MNTNNPITKDQIKCIAVLVSKHGINSDEKAAMVCSYSGGRCTSSKDLFVTEALQMIQYLKSLEPNAMAIVRMQGKIFYYAYEMRWIKKNERNINKPDVERIDQWMIKYSYLKKKLNRYTYEELPKLVSQFEQVYKHFLKSL